MRFPKYFHPVGTSKHGSESFSATRSRAMDVGMLRATPWHTTWQQVTAMSAPRSPGVHAREQQAPTFNPEAKKGIAEALAAMIATESDGVTKNLRPRIMLRSASPSTTHEHTRTPPCEPHAQPHLHTAFHNPPAAAPKSGTEASSTPSATEPSEHNPE